jgi:hypothetical protein
MSEFTERLEKQADVRRVEEIEGSAVRGLVLVTWDESTKTEGLEFIAVNKESDRGMRLCRVSSYAGGLVVQPSEELERMAKGNLRMRKEWGIDPHGPNTVADPGGRDKGDGVA